MKSACLTEFGNRVYIRIPAEKMDLFLERMRQKDTTGFYRAVLVTTGNETPIERVQRLLNYCYFTSARDGDDLVIEHFTSEDDDHFYGVNDVLMKALVGVTPPGSYLTYVIANDEQHGVYQIRFIEDFVGPKQFVIESEGRSLFSVDDRYPFPVVFPPDGEKDSILVDLEPINRKRIKALCDELGLPSTDEHVEGAVQYLRDAMVDLAQEALVHYIEGRRVVQDQAKRKEK